MECDNRWHDSAPARDAQLQCCPDCPQDSPGHSWVAGLMCVHPEDVQSAARERAAFGETVECEKCDMIYAPERQGS